MARYVFVLLHRWVGLTIAAFLFVAGVTGAVISWDHELDEWLNPHLHTVSSTGLAKPALTLAEQVETRDLRVRVASVVITPEPGEAQEMLVEPRIDPVSGKLFEPGYNQIFIDPVSGEELGRREWGRVWPITRETLISFLYMLHFSLHIPEFWGIDTWGLWFMGSVAMLWTIDAFVGFYLTLPTGKATNLSGLEIGKCQLDRNWWVRWKPAWKIKVTGKRYRVIFDLHRAFSLWTWGLLFILAFTAFSLNLYREMFYPIMSAVSQVTPGPFEQRSPAPKHQPVEPTVKYAHILNKSHIEGQRRGWSEPVGALSYNSRFGIYSAKFFHPGGDHGVAGVGPATLYYDGKDGRLLGAEQPWVGTVADIFVQAQLPMHSGRILGLPGRILISIMGLVVAMLSVTGVVIWWRKRAGRVSVRRKTVTRAAGRPIPAE